MRGWARPLENLLAFTLLVTVAFSGGLLARGFWLVLEPSPSINVTVDWSAVGGSESNGETRPDQYARQVADGLWFGDMAAEPEPEREPQPVVAAPETQLQFRLRGVMAGSDPDRGSALISRTSGNSEYFRVGDTIFDQAELMEVYGNRVIISRNGELETLSFEDNLPTGAAYSDGGDVNGSGSSQQAAGQRSSEGASASPGVSSVPGRSSSGNIQPRPEPSGGNDSGSAQQRLEEELRLAIQEVQSRAQSDPQGLLRQYGLEPTDRGYRVTPRAGILIANGLRPGDRITEINDQPVGNIERDQALVDSVLQSDQIKITLERSGATYRFYQSLPNF